GKVELSRGERRQLGGGLIYHYHDEAIQSRWSTHCRRKRAVGGEDPSPVGLMGNKPERSVANRRAVPSGLPQIGRFHSQEEMRRKNREISQQIRKTPLCLSKTHHHARVVRRRNSVEADHLVLPGIARGRIARGVEGPDHIPCRSGMTIVPAYSGLQVERECSTILRPTPGSGQIGLRRHA